MFSRTTSCQGSPPQNKTWVQEAVHPGRWSLVRILYSSPSSASLMSCKVLSPVLAPAFVFSKSIQTNSQLGISLICSTSIFSVWGYFPFPTKPWCFYWSLPLLPTSTNLLCAPQEAISHHKDPCNQRAGSQP